MSSLWKALRWLRGDRQKHWSRADRQAALRELEKRFHLRLTEEAVFQAATLFFALLSDETFINREVIAQKVRRQFSAHANEQEDKEDKT
jgi:hypothetical protein